MRTAFVVAIGMCAGWLCVGCGAAGGRVHDRAGEADRRAERASELTRRATAIAATNAEEAERLLREAVESDPFNGEARNNLGVLLMESGRLFDAALAFEAARKLMPASPEPRMNLGLTFERAGRIDDAIAAYEDAIEADESHVPAMQALAMCRVRHAREHASTDALLREIAIRGETEAWRNWAAEMLLKREDGGEGDVGASEPSPVEPA